MKFQHSCFVLVAILLSSVAWAQADNATEKEEDGTYVKQHVDMVLDRANDIYSGIIKIMQKVLFSNECCTVDGAEYQDGETFTNADNATCVCNAGSVDCDVE
ncbi:uncharacterized protein LOC122249429 [Penaeus japonicus]|uniref:uncharacterized protein LOC122249429 n=1 Tax=Penaeus japonicus TaxID=27405 RepID=UPI001C711FA7|nr:uncharacterized protein LOC122249429 [Penaeus japonicus]